MATLKILRCKNCTAPLPAGTTTCPKCHAVNLVQSEVNPLQLPSNLTNDYIEFFKQQTEANPKDTNALFGMGLVYMGLKNYEFTNLLMNRIRLTNTSQGSEMTLSRR